MADDSESTTDDDVSGDAAHLSRLGEFIRAQRRLAALSQRELARLSDLSDTYLSQLERGRHEPSVRALRSIAKALGTPTAALLRHLGVEDELADLDAELATRTAIRQDNGLTEAQKQALLTVYESFLSENR
ncbi:MAG: helix-turn-helix transcriptional regulator [Acidimicrobiales bacterium]|nr:helix-turn-helix transcriptional regulator [Acidimicrobiales bacterium]